MTWSDDWIMLIGYFYSVHAEKCMVNDSTEVRCTSWYLSILSHCVNCRMEPTTNCKL
jgi:hypothetical protein